MPRQFVSAMQRALAFLGFESSEMLSVDGSLVSYRFPVLKRHMSM